MAIKTMKIPVFLAAAISLVIIAGCKVGPKYARPDYTGKSAFRFDTVKDSISFADTSWTYLFKDSVLNNLIRTGLQNNFDLKMAFERVNQARAQFKVVRADIYPSLSVSGNADYNNAASPNGGRLEYNDYYATANISWELDLWGKLRRASESAKADLFAQEAYQQGIRVALIAEIAIAYFNLLEYEDELQITKYNVEIRKKSLELVKYKLIAGTVSGLTVAQAEAQLANVTTQVPALEITVARQENALRFLIGELPGPINTGDSIVNQINTDIVPATGFPSQLIVRRPDIMAAEQTLISANAQVGVARAKMLPTLGITASIGYSYLGAGIIGSAVGNLVAPIFNMGKLKQGLRRSQSYKEEMLVSYQSAIYKGITEVSNGIIAVEKQKEVVAENVKLIAAAQTSYDLSDQLFNAGYASFLDVLDAQRVLYQAQVSQSRDLNNQLQYVVNLYLALGGGWK
jgi:NodT family efflux transporter outer membrane factor (OMF) lipoprotein